MNEWGITVAEAEEAARQSAEWIRESGVKVDDVPSVAALWVEASSGPAPERYAKRA